MEVLNEVLPVFEKACSVYTEEVSLSDVVNKNLAKCDGIRVQIKECLHMDRQDVEEAKQLEKKCERLLGKYINSFFVGVSPAKICVTGVSNKYVIERLLKFIITWHKLIPVKSRAPIDRDVSHHASL